MRTLGAFLLLILGVSFYGVGQTPVDSRERQIVIRNVSIVPMDQERILTGQTVVVENGKIKTIGGNVKPKSGALVVDGTGKFLMPGLAEMHAHVPPIDDFKPMEKVLTLFATHGITTIRGMLGHSKHLELRAKLASGEILGPRFLTTGPSFNGMSVTSPEAGAQMVRRQKEQGFDYLKLHPGLTKQKFDSIAATAKRVGIPFAGHVSFGVGVWHAIESGYSSIDHLDGFVEGLVPGIEKMNEKEAGLFGMHLADAVQTERIPELMKALRENDIWVVPTQALAERWFSPDFTVDDFQREPQSKYVDKKMVDQWIASKESLTSGDDYDAGRIRRFIELRRSLIKACQENGVGLLLGCDAPQVFNVPGISTHQELDYLVRSGLTPYQALRTGTVNVANYLKLHDAGVIKAGAIADLVLVRGNPLEDITNTSKIDGVMLDGKWLSKAWIDSALKQVQP